MTTIPLQAEQTSQAVETAHASTVHAASAANVGPFNFPDHWPAQGELLTWSQQIGPALAALMVLMGVIYLLFGYNIFKALMVLNAAVLGAIIGAAIGDKTGGTLPLSITTGFVLAAITWPMMRWAVVVTGALCGAAIGVGMWRTFNLEPNFAWAGSGMGLIFFGLLTFILFRGCVMTYMSLQGAAMLIFGLLALTFKYDGLTLQVSHWFKLKPFLLPMMVFIPTVLGVMFQHHNGAPAAAAPSGKK
ncbi:MAG TPA: hypothetical protein VG326_03440 [Tepidisphaeraceae bacterium]|jgi:hypothetical protein|nr:hypothetical protein [Tepidisphaeraceae bacterium]